MQPVKLYYLAPSHYCEKARKILEYKGIPFELVDVPYGNHQEVLRVSGQDYVPYIEVPGGKGVLWHEVADWAERVKPEPTLYPNGTRARCRVSENWSHNVVEEMAWRYVVSEVPAAIKDPQARWVFTELQERKRGPLEVMAMRKQEFLGGLKEVCGLVEDLLGANPYLFGAAASLADFALYGALHPLKLTKNEIPKEFPALRAWHERVHAL